MKNIFFTIIYMLLCSFVANAETVYFRGGEVFVAEMSTKKPAIRGENKDAFVNEYYRPIYAAMSIKVGEGRKLSIYDFSIELFGKSYPCIAIGINGSNFSASDWKIENPNNNKKYTLLFLLDGRSFGYKDYETLNVKSNFPPKKNEINPVEFKFIENKNFTTSISQNGLLRKIENNE